MTKLKQEKSTETLQEAKIFTKLKIGSIILRIVYSSKETFPPIEKYKILLIKEYLLFLITQGTIREIRLSELRVSSFLVSLTLIINACNVKRW